MRLFDGQALNDFLLGDVDDFNFVAIADWDRNIFSVWRHSDLVGPATDLHRPNNPSSFRVNDPQSVVRLDRRKKPLSVGLYGDSMNTVSQLDVADDLEGRKVNNADIVAATIPDVKQILGCYGRSA